MNIGLIDVDGWHGKKNWGATVYHNIDLKTIARWHAIRNKGGISMNEDIYVEGNYFICPYCGAKIRINPEIFSNYAMDDEEEVYCEDCDHTFIAFREVDVCYGSRKLNNNGKDQY